MVSVKVSGMPIQLSLKYDKLVALLKFSTFKWALVFISALPIKWIAWYCVPVKSIDELITSMIPSARMDMG